MTTTYTVVITEEQRMLLQRAASRLVDDLNASKVPGLAASDATTGFGMCIGDEVEALRDMMLDLEPGDAINYFDA